MNFAKLLTLIGAVLIVIAWIVAASIPADAHADFDLLVRRAGSLTHTVSFPDVYKQMCANSRMLQDFFVGAAGLICLAIGLARWKADAQ